MAAGTAPATLVTPDEAVGTNYLVYIDGQFTITPRRNLVLDKLKADLGRMGPHDQMSVVSFDGHKLKRLSDWTGDRKALEAVFAEEEDRPSFGLLALADMRSGDEDSVLPRESGSAVVSIKLQVVFCPLEGTLVILSSGHFIPSHRRFGPASPLLSVNFRCCDPFLRGGVMVIFSIRRMAAIFATIVSLPLAARVMAEDVKQPELVQIMGETIDVRVVNVEAVVTGRSGQQVRGLAVGDFRLMVDGKEVPVEYFAEVAEGASVTAESPNPAAPATTAPALPVRTGEAVGRSYLVYVDDSFSLVSRRNAVLDKLERDLSLLRPEDRMAVLGFDGYRIAVLSRWTGDVKALRAALEQARQRPAHGDRALAQQRALQHDEDAVLDAELQGDQTRAALESLSNRVSPEARTQLGRTATAAAAALRGFESPPGRKVMMLLSGAWSLSVAPQLYGPMVSAANRLGYTVYPVDAAMSDPREVTVLDKLARATGGRVMVSATNEAFRDMVADSSSYYWLGFTPSWKANDKGHKVTVEVRKPELTVRARNGFSDLSRKTETAMKAESVLMFGGATEDRRLIVQLGEPRRQGRDFEVPVTLGVPVEALALTPNAKGYLAEVPLAIATLDGNGGRADLPASHLKVAVTTLPRTGTYARFQTVVRLRQAGQKLVFTVPDAVSGQAIWGQADFQLESIATLGKRR